MKFKKLSGFRKKMVKTRNQKRQIISKKFLLYTMEIWGAKEKEGGKQQKENDFLQKQNTGQQDGEEKVPACISPQQQQFGSHPWESILHKLWDQVGNCETPVESKIE